MQPATRLMGRAALSGWAQTAASDTNAWWQVDLGSEYGIEEVQVFAALGG